MAENRLRCLTKGCENTILSATAKHTGGYCGPCYGKMHKAARDEYVRQNRKDVDLYAGITDPVEIIRIAHVRRPHDPLIRYLPPPRSLEELYVSLTLPQAEKVMNLAAQSLRNGDNDFAEDVARLLAAFTDYNLDGMLATWLDLDRFWPALAFRFGGSNVRNRLLTALRSEHVNANHALQAAAWIGDHAVMKAFEAFDAVPLGWARSLHLRPSAYARTAAWELVGGKRRELSLKRCFSIIPAPPGSDSGGVHIFQETQDRCPWCNSPLVNLLHIDAKAEPFLQFGLAGTCFEVRTCYRCTAVGVIFGELDADGNGRLAQENVDPEFVPETWDRSPWSGIPVELRARRSIHAADYFLPTTHTQIETVASGQLI